MPRLTFDDFVSYHVPSEALNTDVRGNRPKKMCMYTKMDDFARLTVPRAIVSFLELSLELTLQVGSLQEMSRSK